MATQPPLSTTSNLPVQTHFPVHYTAILFPAIYLKIAYICSHSNKANFFDGSDYRYRPEQVFNGIKYYLSTWSRPETYLALTSNGFSRHIFRCPHLFVL